MKFYICDHDGARGGSPCIFTERSMSPLWKRTGGDIARCIRHGQLITTERNFPDKKAAQQWARGDKGAPDGR